jgi:hypothetical protein
MRNQVNNSQSTEARNSAVVNFTNYSNKIEIPVLGFSRDSIISWVGEAVEDKRKDVSFCGWIEGGKSIEVHIIRDLFSKNYKVVYTMFDDGKAIREKSGSIDLGFKVLSGTNINKTVGAITRALEELPLYFVEDMDSKAIEAIEEVEISEAPSLDQAPCLEDDYTIEEVCDGFYEIVFNDDEDEDITWGENTSLNEDFMSLDGLEYLAESMNDVNPHEIIKAAVREYFYDPYAVSQNRVMGFYDAELYDFCDIIWPYAWSMVEHLADPALESEAKYYLEFNDRVRFMVDNGELGALYLTNGHVRSSVDVANPDVVFAYDDDLAF